MIYDSEKWIRIVKGKSVDLTDTESKYVAALIGSAENFYRSELRIKRKQAQSTLLIVGRLLDMNFVQRQAIVNLKQDVNSIVRKKLSY